MLVLDDRAVRRLYKAARAERWGLPVASFRDALEASLRYRFGERMPDVREAERYLSTLHLPDLAVACACAEGHEPAWEHIVHEYRPALYRAADALDPSGGARELADAIYGELYARSLFRYFHGRSSLATWLRSVLAQRHVDAVRSRRRLEPLPEDEPGGPTKEGTIDPDATRYCELLEDALRTAVERLTARDQLRLGCYYVQQATLAEVGRLLGEHEASVSRHLARTRRAVRATVEDVLRGAGLADAEIEACVRAAVEDSSTLDLNSLFANTLRRKILDAERSQEEQD